MEKLAVEERTKQNRLQYNFVILVGNHTCKHAKKKNSKFTKLATSKIVTNISGEKKDHIFMTLIKTIQRKKKTTMHNVQTINAGVHCCILLYSPQPNLCLTIIYRDYPICEA